MILSYGVVVINKGRENEHHYHFFDDPDHNGQDAVYGLRGPLHHLVNALKSAAHEYGIEKRVLLLHGRRRGELASRRRLAWPTATSMSCMSCWRSMSAGC